MLPYLVLAGVALYFMTRPAENSISNVPNKEIGVAVALKRPSAGDTLSLEVHESGKGGVVLKSWGTQTVRVLDVSDLLTLKTDLGTGKLAAGVIVGGPHDGSYVAVLFDVTK